MPTEPAPPTIQVTLAGDTLHRVQRGTTAVRTSPAIFRVEGPGAVACLQGLLTNDVEKPGVGAMVYGAMLTPKGMIVLDLWALRSAEAFTLIADPSAREPAMELFRRSLPPRLAQVTDLTGSHTVAWLIGDGAQGALRTAGGAELPAAGRIIQHDIEGKPVQLGVGTPQAWFRALAVGPAGRVDTLVRNLRASGVVEGTDHHRHAARILAGWPALGAEIGERTLPQEVRFDEVGGVSYTKGCYTGQETVARVHFRGHPNRELRGVTWDDHRPIEDGTVASLGREVGAVSSVLLLPGRRLGLAVIRREVEVGQEVTVGGCQARVVALPMDSSIPAS